ncbi:hypothetical protein GE300_11310 [Rhodobacteraceae bacterium 2CG4]|uniref:Membrane protein YjdF n=1 Tax=Halovulum marinum TaxID=2662447 RepID=A0A6L5Z1N7_9RHOB|nr:hypothetical protein [Halovulum marinum]MSU90199.1 hypothetical protein [Halovulum marinum]
MPSSGRKILSRAQTAKLIVATAAVAALASTITGRWSLVFISLVTLALALVPIAFAQGLGLRLPVAFVVWIVAFVFGAIFMGEAFDFYEKVWWWDIALHGFSAVGFGLLGFLFAFMLFEGDSFAAPATALAVISFAFGISIGTLWEIFEYGVDQVFGANMQKSGLDDTMGDLMVDTLGAAAGAASGYLYLKGRDYLAAGLIAEFIEHNRALYRKARFRRRR